MRRRVIIFYGTWHGQTRRIALRLADRLREAGLDASAASVERVDLDFHPGGYALIVLGGAVRSWRYRPELGAFARRWRDELRRVPTAFYSVSASAGSDDPRAQLRNRTWIERFCAETGLIPARTAIFAGALPYTRYPPLLRLVMKLIVALGGGPTDTSRDHELTDWDQVDVFAEELVELVRGEPEPELTTTDASIRA